MRGRGGRGREKTEIGMPEATYRLHDKFHFLSSAILFPTLHHLLSQQLPSIQRCQTPTAQSYHKIILLLNVFGDMKNKVGNIEKYQKPEKTNGTPHRLLQKQTPCQERRDTNELDCPEFWDLRES